MMGEGGMTNHLEAGYWKIVHYLAQFFLLFIHPQSRVR